MAQARWMELKTIPAFQFDGEILSFRKKHRCVVLFLMFAEAAMSEQQRNALLFQWITSEVSFPVVHLHSYNSHIFPPTEYQRLCQVRPAIWYHCWTEHLRLSPEGTASMFGHHSSRSQQLLCFLSNFKNSCLCTISCINRHGEANAANKQFTHVANTWQMFTTVCFCYEWYDAF